jgi:enoyl-CoA hydratase/carnithine racemase
VVVGGTGDRAFCSGADLAQRAEDTGGISHGGGDSFRPAFDLLLREIVSFPAPVIAAVNGAALGAGMQLAVACDLRVVAPNATFAIPAGRLGVLLSAVNVERLVRAVGQPMARDVLLTARVLDVDEAAAVGLVQRRQADAVLGAQALAAEIAALAPLSVRGHKTVLNRVGASSTLSDDELGVLAELELAAFQSRDLQEGLAAFSEKRRPRFTGA